MCASLSIEQSIKKLKKWEASSYLLASHVRQGYSFALWFDHHWQQNVDRLANGRQSCGRLANKDLLAVGRWQILGWRVGLSKLASAKADAELAVDDRAYLDLEGL